MQFTLKKDINIDSLVLKHNILLDASTLLQGREGVLQTEKDIYLMISFINALIQEDLLQMCNDDKRGLAEIIVEEIEPFFNKLVCEEHYKVLYEEVRILLRDRCKEIWDNQHSVIGVIDAILTTLETMSDEDKKDALVMTAEIAKKAHEHRTNVIAQNQEILDEKMQQLISKYQKTSEITEEKKQ